ncbi:MAG: VOC family protein [Solirubrobacteraceae bacterium]
MMPAPAKPVVHLELHTDDRSRACAFYAHLCGWRSERIEAGGGTYWALGLGGGFGGGGVVECETQRPLWLPYVEVADIAGVTEQARGLGAAVLLEPREGPAGWRSVVAAPAGGEVAFWQPKERPESEDFDRSAMSSGSSAGLTWKLHRHRRRPR